MKLSARPLTHLDRPFGRPRSSHSIFAAALVAGFGAITAFAAPPANSSELPYEPDHAVYYPLATSPVNANPALRAIEVQLVNGVGPKPLQLPVIYTLSLPPVGGATPSSKVLTAAVQAAVADAIDNPGPFTAAQIARAAVDYTPKNASAFEKALVSTVLASTGTTSLEKATLLGDITFELTTVAGKSASSVAGAAITALSGYRAGSPIASLSEPDLIGFNETVVDEAVNAQKSYAAKIVSSAIAGSKKAGFVVADEIAGAALSAALTSEPGSPAAPQLAEEISRAALAASVKLVAPAGQPDVVKDVTLALLNAANAHLLSDKSSIIQIVAAAVGGVGKVIAAPATLNQLAVVAAVHDSVFSALEGDAVVAIEIYNKVYLAAAAKAPVGTVVANYITANGLANIEAIAAGAVQGSSKSSVAIASDGLGAIVGNVVKGADFLREVVRAYPSNALKITTATVKLGNAGTPAETTATIIQSAGQDLAGGVTGAAIKSVLIGQTLKTVPGAIQYKADVVAIVDAATGAAATAGFDGAYGSIAYNATKGSKLAGDVIHTLVGKANLGVPVVDSVGISSAIAAAIHADSKNLAAIQVGYQTAILSNPERLKIADTAASISFQILTYSVPKPALKDPAYFYKLTNAFLTNGSVDLTNKNEVLGLLAATTQANAKGLSALASTVVLQNASSATAAEIVATAAWASPKLTVNVQSAVDVALHVKADLAAQAADPLYKSDLFDYVAAQSTLAGTVYSVDVATGATIANPAQAHYIAHAIGFRQPKAIAKAIVPIFTFSSIDRVVPGNSTNDPAERASAITAGAVDGVLESGLVAKSTSSVLKGLVSTAVKTVVSQSLFTTKEFVRVNPADIGTTTTGFVSASSAVVTAYISQVVTGAETPADAINATVQSILTAAAKSAKKYVAEGYINDMAQAAATAAATLYINYGGHAAPVAADYANIVLAFTAAVGPTQTAALVAAVQLGVNEANAAHLGVGALGVVSYTLHPVSGTFVTSIFNL